MAIRESRSTINMYWAQNVETNAFGFETPEGRYEVSGTYYLSNLLQELSLAYETGTQVADLKPDRIFEPPADRISRSIRELYWDGLTRRIDEKGLFNILSDEKTVSTDGLRHVYVPADDKIAYDYSFTSAKDHPELKAKIDYLPENVTADFVRKLDGYHGLFSLGMYQDEHGELQAIPFVVPGGRFNEMYGWDSYFITLGLLQDNRIELAKSMVDNFIYEIHHYRKILNANRTYYLTRSQPPFFTSMLYAVYQRLPKTKASKEWLKTALNAAITEYFQVWMSPSRLMKTGLSRYFDSGNGQSPEVEPGHFTPVLRRYSKKYGMDPKSLEEAYKSGKVKSPELDTYFVHDRCMRESGHDTSYRLENRCADLTTVDLNSLLYRIETDIAEILQKEFNGQLKTTDGKRQTASDWTARASKAKGARESVFVE